MKHLNLVNNLLNSFNKKRNALKYLSSKYSSLSIAQKLESNGTSSYLETFTNSRLSYANTLYPEFRVQPDTIGDRVNKWATEKPNNVSYIFPHNRMRLTFLETQQRVHAIARNLLSLGFKKGDRIAFLLPNTHELLVSFLAAASIGAVSVIMNPAYQAVEIEYMLKKTGAKGLVIYDSFKVLQHYELLRKLCPEIDSSEPGELNSSRLPELKHIIVLNSPLLGVKKSYKGTWSYDSLATPKSSGGKIELPHVEMDDPCMILFTVKKNFYFYFINFLYKKYSLIQL